MDGYKRVSIRMVAELAENLSVIAKKRGLSVNSLISEIAWDFVDAWKLRVIEREKEEK